MQQQEHEVNSVPVDQENNEVAESTENASVAQDDTREVTAEHIAACFKTYDTTANDSMSTAHFNYLLKDIDGTTLDDVELKEALAVLDPMSRGSVSLDKVTRFLREGL